MDTITLTIGESVTSSGGPSRDDTRQVEFVGELLAHRRTYGEHKGKLSDTRGRNETLYRAEDGRLIVHVENWSRWSGEPTTGSLSEVTEADLQPGGRYEALGAEAGYGRPLTLDEALSRIADEKAEMAALFGEG